MTDNQARDIYNNAMARFIDDMHRAFNSFRLNNDQREFLLQREYAQVRLDLDIDLIQNNLICI